MQRPWLVILALAVSLQAQDVSGTYTGSLKNDSGNEHSGSLVIKQDGETLAITVGPRLDRQQPVSKIERNGASLKFELFSPDGATLMKFDLTVKDGKVTGAVATLRGDEKTTGTLDLVKQ